MPVTIKAANVKYKSPSTGQYVGVNSVSDNTTADQITAINAAGQQQINAVQTKGQQTIDSIPSDYTNLSNEVTALNNTKATKTDLVETQAEICNDFRYEGETYVETLPAGMIVQYVPENAPIRLVRITTDIPAGSTIQQGTNAEVVNIAGLLAELIPATGVSF